MSKQNVKEHRFSAGEEFANAISHGLGAIFAVVILVLLVTAGSRHGTIWHTISFAIYGSSMLLVFLSSTFNHALPVGKAKDFFHNFDQIAIYLLIAGTYTPMALVALRKNWGWTIFGLEWGFALAGIIVKVFLPNKFEKGVNIFVIISYVIMGWLLLFFLIPFYEQLTKAGMIWLFTGGGFYTLGVLFFKLEKLKFHHLIWHIFVVAGAFCHFMAVYKYVLPLN